MKLLRRRPSLPPAPEGQEDYWATVHVVLHQPQRVEDDEPDDSGPIVGYYRNFGIRTSSALVPSVIEHAIRDGKVDWAGSEWYPVDVSTLDALIRRQIQHVEGDPIWYVSGHIFYSAEEDEAPAH
jgi:hypothetical protein